MDARSNFDVVVAGAGPAGLACALALAARGDLWVAVVAPERNANGGRDTRTAALFPSSVALLSNLGAWDACRAVAEPLRAIRLIDATDAPLTAPEVLFEASELGLDAFAWNVPNEALTTALLDAARTRASNLAFVNGAIRSLSYERDRVHARLEDGGALAARLLVAADGRNSVCRAAAGIPTETWSYDQSAIACAFDHGRPHKGISTEFHTASGPATTVPMPRRASGLVWVDRSAVAKRLAALDDDAFRAALERRLQGLLGAVGNIGPRGVFPLSGLTAASLYADRVALVGEAGHVLPPIGAQGLNLGLRDGATLADAVHDAWDERRDLGAADVLAAYARQREADVVSRRFAVGFLNRALLASALPPVHLARGLALIALGSIGPLRRRLMREGLGPPGPLPRLMTA